MKLHLEKASESYLVGVLLAIAGGYLDVYTYICRGGVFANAQTGNIVLLGINMADQNWDKILFYMYPILAFMAGILITEYVRRRFRYNPGLHWRQIVIVIEFAVLWVIAFTPSGVCDDLINSAVSFVCSMQVESFRRFNGSAMLLPCVQGICAVLRSSFFITISTRTRKLERRVSSTMALFFSLISDFSIELVLLSYTNPATNLAIRGQKTHSLSYHDITRYSWLQLHPDVPPILPA